MPTKIVWTFVRSHDDIHVKEAFYDNKKMKELSLVRGNKQNRVSYLACRFPNCPYRIKFVEDTTGCVNEYSSSDERVQHAVHPDGSYRESHAGLNDTTKEWIDLLIEMGFQSTQAILNKMATLPIPPGASIPAKKTVSIKDRLPKTAQTQRRSVFRFGIPRYSARVNKICFFRRR